MELKNVEDRVQSIMKKIIASNEMIKVERYSGSFDGVQVTLTTIRDNKYARDELRIDTSVIKVISEETLKAMLNTFVMKFREGS